MARGKYLSLEEARKADQIKRFCKVFYNHPLVTVGLGFRNTKLL